MLTTSLVRVRALPPRQTLASPVLEARDQLSRRVLDSIGAEGSVRGDCESRVLESALALCLMQRHDVLPSARERVVGYLQRQWFQTRLDPFNHVLSASVLGWHSRISAAAAIDAYLEGFEHFTARRKRIFFSIVLAAVTGERVEFELRKQDFATGPEHQRWVVVMMRALEVLYFVSRGQPEQVSSADLAALTVTGSRGANNTWEQYLLAHLLSLLALSIHGAHHDRVTRELEDLVAQQRADGGFSFITSMEIFATATAGLGLVGAGVSPHSLLRTGDYLAEQQQLDGGWGYAQGVRQTDVDDTAYCVELLRAIAPHRYRHTIRRAEHYLIAMQNEDGGFPTFAVGSSSEVAMTAAALNALAPNKQRYAHVFGRAIQFIFDHQSSDGTFERSWSSAHSNAIFRALLAIQTHNRGLSTLERERAEVKAMSYLRLSQNEDGGWGHVIGDLSDPISSAYALITLSHFDAEFTIGRGVEYLVDQQQCNGGYLSKPDQSGPRPITYDVPALANNFALIALDHVISTHPRL